VADQYGNNSKKEQSTDAETGLKRDSSGLGYHKPVDISKRVDKASDVDSGFSGELPKGE
jgi:hypothetical protein